MERRKGAHITGVRENAAQLMTLACMADDEKQLLVTVPDQT